MSFRVIGSVVTVLVLATAAVGVLWWQADRGTSKAGEPRPTAPLTATEASTATGARVFFGHQSVGGNVMSQVPAVYLAHGQAAPDVLEVGAGVSEVATPPAGGFWAETLIGENGDPLGKIADFDGRIRGGIGGQVDVALMKLCYVDITAGSDVQGVFTRYRETLAALERDYPHVTFIAVTVPLTTEPTDAKGVIKGVIKGVAGQTSDNVARERFNALVRAEYGGDRLFDLAAIESTRPDGTREARGNGADQYFALYEGYASDPGHLNEKGSELAATELVRLVARATTH